MKNFCTFVLSTTLVRGVEPAPQGGFFCVPAKGFSTYKRRPAFTEPGSRPGITRASGVVDSGIRQAAFLFAKNVNYTHNVTPNQRGEIPHRHTPAIPASGRQNGCRRPENPARIVAQPQEVAYFTTRIRGARSGHFASNVASFCSEPIFSLPASRRGA